MRVAIIGCGAVGAIHAARLRRAGVPVSAVCGSSLAKAQRFAAAHGVERAAADLDSALEDAEAAIVASPSQLHYDQALRVLERGVHALIELPPCSSAAEAERLGQAAERSHAVLQCAHTSRYLEPYRRIGTWIREGRSGEIRQVHYYRQVVPSPRSWTDDALWHHGAHPLDLLLDWFGSLLPLGAAAQPQAPPYRDVSLVGRLPGGGPAAISVSYSARHPAGSMTVIGEAGTVITDGFTYIQSDISPIRWAGDAAATYEQAIEDQDLAFLRACDAGGGAIAWTETMRMIECAETFRRLAPG